MKAFLVIRRFKDGSAEGVMFTDKADADMALSSRDLWVTSINDKKHWESV